MEFHLVQFIEFLRQFARKTVDDLVESGECNLLSCILQSTLTLVVSSIVLVLLVKSAVPSCPSITNHLYFPPRTGYFTTAMSESEADFNEPSTFFNLAAAFSCTCLAALCAGLTMGLLSLDTLKLKIKLMTGSPEEIKAVSQVLPLLKNHHYLLCSLLIANAGANEALPIFLDELLPSYAAILVSVTIVLIFGEVRRRGGVHASREAAYILLTREKKI